MKTSTLVSFLNAIFDFVYKCFTNLANGLTGSHKLIRATLTGTEGVTSRRIGILVVNVPVIDEFAILCPVYVSCPVTFGQVIG